jgi:Glycosyl transferase family 2
MRREDVVSTERIGGFEVEHLCGPEEISYKDNELVVVCLVRDGEPWVRAFVEHYIALGARHLVFLDNNSSDGTVSAASEYDDVTVLRVALPFDADVDGTRGQVVMRKYLIERFGKGRWSLCVDIDELFDYPYSDVIGLESLLGYLDSKSYTAVVAQMLDMFPERPLLELADGPDEPLKEVHRFYDISGLERVSRKERSRRLSTDNITLESDEIEWFSGGLRRTIFDLPGPWLTKYPLVFCDGSLEPDPPHGVRNARLADFSCVLFHYKFLKNFREQAVRAVREEQYFSKSRAYKRYLATLDQNPELRLRLESSKEIASVNELLESRFLVASEDYVGWVDAEEERSFSNASLQAELDVSAEALLRSRRQERAMTLRAGKLEHRLLVLERQHKWQRRVKTRRIRTLRRKLGDRVQEVQDLGTQVLDRDQRIMALERELRDRGRRLGDFKRRTQNLTQRNIDLKRQIENIESSRAWRIISIIHTIQTRLSSLLQRR